MLKFLVLVALMSVSASSLKMELVYEWEKLDLQFPSSAIRQEMTENGTYVSININGMGVHKDKLFVISDWWARTPVTLTYMDLKDQTKPPLLKPYPRWEAHFVDQQGQRLINKPIRIHVDRCDRLWILELVGERLHIIVFGLNTDTVLRRHMFPRELGFKMYYNWIAVEDKDCRNTFAYVNDPVSGGFWIYSWVEDESWRVSGSKNIFGMLLAPNSDNFSTIYYNTHESRGKVYSISTECLRRNANNCTGNVKIENRNVNLRASIYNALTNTMYISNVSSTNILVLPCWNKNKECDINGIGGVTIVADKSTNFGDDMAVDAEGNVWIESKQGTFITLHKLDRC